MQRSRLTPRLFFYECEGCFFENDCTHPYFGAHAHVRVRVGNDFLICCPKGARRLQTRLGRADASFQLRLPLAAAPRFPREDF